MKEKKRAVMIVCAVLVVLAAAIAVLAYLNAPKDMEEGQLLLVRGESTLASWTMEELKALPAVETYKEITSSNHAGDSGTFRGVALHMLLESVGEEALADVTKVYVYARDGYTTSYKLSEVSGSDAFLLAYSKDGQGLGTMSSNGTGPLRLIVVNDEFGTRSCKYVYKIEVK